MKFLGIEYGELRKYRIIVKTVIKDWKHMTAFSKKYSLFSFTVAKTPCVFYFLVKKKIMKEKAKIFSFYTKITKF